MHLIDEYYQKIEVSDNKNNKDKMFWTFDVDANDFFLKSCLYWQSVISDAYTLSIGTGTLTLPYNYYIVIGDYDSGFDCITPEEIMGREFDVYTFSNDMSEGSNMLEPVSVIGYEEDVSFVLPFVKSIFPVMISDKRSMFIINKDSYNSFKTLSISDIL